MEISTTDFDLNRFFSRYLCGGAAIKDFRKVSRKRLALIESGVAYDDSEAEELSKLIDRYNKAVKKLTATKITRTRLCKVNKDLMLSAKTAGTIRKTDIWFGKNKDAVIFKPPSHEKLNSLLGTWTKDVNEIELEVDDILKLYSRFLKIHPFTDGNGRTGRIIVEALFKKHRYEYLHPDLFRFGKYGGKFVDGVHTLQKHSKHIFWQEWLAWNPLIFSKIENILNQTKEELKPKKLRNSLSTLAFRTIQTLWNNPIVHFNTLVTRLNCKREELEKVMDELLRSNILIEKRLRNKYQDFIYEAWPVIHCWHKIDNLVFEQD